MARKGRKARKTRGARNIPVKGHTRSPRGPNAGKSIVRVKRHRRRHPKT